MAPCGLPQATGYNSDLVPNIRAGEQEHWQTLSPVGPLVSLMDNAALPLSYLLFLLSACNAISFEDIDELSTRNFSYK